MFMPGVYPQRGRVRLEFGEQEGEPLAKNKPLRPRGDGAAVMEWLARSLADLFYFAAPDAARAHVYADVGAASGDGLDLLKVRLGRFLCFIVGVTHLVAAESAFAADLTFSCHGVTSGNGK
jgi:hypothetical protein